MKHILFLIPVLLTASAARPKEKKSTLEDVERGYITTKARLSPPPLPIQASSPKIPAKSPTQFGFVPVKTADSYTQKEPKIIYAQPEYNPIYQQKSQYNTIAYSVPQQQGYSLTSDSGSHYAEYKQPSVGVQYAPETQQRAQPQPQAYYVPQPQQEHYLNNYDNLQYVNDNSIEQNKQQYYNPQQYYYLQQYQAPSTSIQAIVDPKGGLQYIMYIPTYVPNQSSEQPQNVEYTSGEQQPPQYTTYTEKQPAQYTTYTEKQNYEVGKSSYAPKGEVIINREPKSLLDSYIPSSLQLQYYKQAQAHLNSLQDTQKYGNYHQLEAESNSRYNYRPRSFK